MSRRGPDMVHHAIAIAAFVIGLWMLIGCAVAGGRWLIAAISSIN